ncbi:unnamed protein product [Caenorhabditis brenneri]
MDSQRQDMFSFCISTENLSLDQVITAESIKNKRKPLNFLADFYDWATIDQISAIEFMKKFDFVKELKEKELKFFIKNSYVQYIMFCVAMRAVGLKRADAAYPDGVDVFPEEIRSLYKKTPQVLAKVRCPLVSKIIELNVTREEFVLLSAVIICNPETQCYSEPSRNLIAHHRNLHASALVHHCLLQNSRFGPARFVELLSLCQTINTTFEAFGAIWIRYSMSQPNPKLGRLYMDFLEYILKK